MTLGRIPIAVLFLVVLIYSPKTIFTLALQLILLLIIEFTDLYDGIIARRFGLVSEAGATLDPFADSVSRLIIYWALATQGLVLFLVPLIMALRDITVAYSRIVLAQNNRTVSAKKSGKLRPLFKPSVPFWPCLAPTTGTLLDAGVFTPSLGSS